MTGTTAVESSGSVEFHIELSEPSNQPILAVFNTSDGSAKANVDYQPIRDQELIFAPGETLKSISVEVTDNLMQDGFRFFEGAVTTSDVGEGALNRLTDDVVQYTVSKDGHTVFYSDTVGAVYRMRLDGSVHPIQLSPPNPGIRGDPSSMPFLPTPDGRHVIFYGSFEESIGLHLYRVPVDGASAPVRLTVPLATGFLVDNSHFAITPDSETVVYHLSSADSNVAGFYSVPVDGSTSPVNLGTERALSNAVRLASEGRRIVYQDLTRHVYSVAVDGSEDPIKLSDGIDQSFSFRRFDLTPDGKTALVTGRTGIYSFPVDGASPPTLLFEYQPHHSPGLVRATDDSRSVVVTFSKGSNSPRELYVVPVDGSADPLRLNSPFSTGQYVLDFDVSSSGELIAYSFLQDSSIKEIYSVPTDGAAPPKRLSNAEDVGNANSVTVTPSGALAVFAASKQVGGETFDELYSVATDGASDPVPLVVLHTRGERINVHDFPPTISSDGKSVTYIVDREGVPVAMYNVRIDGSSSPKMISGQIAPDGALRAPTLFIFASGGIVFSVHEDDPSHSPPNVVNLYSNTSLATEFVSRGRATIRDDKPSVDDFGDAPSSIQSGFESDYPVTFAQDGARHTVGSLFLGGGIDTDFDGQPDADAGQTGLGGDDANEADSSSGVSVLNSMLSLDTSTISSVQVNVSEAGKIDAWVDFNQDGDWSDPGEQILAGADVVAGDNTLAFDVPAGAVPGSTGARFRLSSDGGLEPTGAAPDGEVEDLIFSIIGNESSPVDVRVISGNHPARLRLEGSRIYVRELDVDKFGASVDDISTVRLVGSEGDDNFVVFANVVENIPVSVDGADGTNLLRLRNPNNVGSEQRVFDFTDDGNLSSDNIQTIALGSLGVTRVVLDALSVSRISRAGIVTIRGDENDEILLEDADDWRMDEAFTSDEGFVRQVRNVAGNQVIAFELPNAWQNVVNAKDINNDGEVTALDAIRVINELFRRGSGEAASELADPTTLPQWPGIYLDSTGDDRLTALDALVVINSLARQSVSRESEGVAESVWKTNFRHDDDTSDSDPIVSTVRETSVVTDCVDKRLLDDDIGSPNQEVASTAVSSTPSVRDEDSDSGDSLLDRIRSHL